MASKTYSFTLSTPAVQAADRDLLDGIIGKGQYSLSGTTVTVASETQGKLAQRILTTLVLPGYAKALYAPSRAEHSKKALTHQMWSAHKLSGMRSPQADKLSVPDWIAAYVKATKAAKAKAAKAAKAKVAEAVEVA